MTKQEALAAAMKKIEKDFGKGSIMRLGDDTTRRDVKAVSTGILPLDIALGIGGLPRGRITEIYGPEAGGKTTVTLHMIAEVQRQGGTAAFIDAEHALDPVYAKRLGVDVDNLLLSQPDTGEQGLDIAETLIRSAAVDIVVIDSVAALVPKSEIDGEMGDTSVGLHARMMSKAMRKLAGVISKTETIAVFINQVREKVGVMFGNPEVTTGGRALKFYSSVRLEVRKGEPIKQGSEVVGNRVKIKVSKNKVAPPFRTAEFDLIYGEGYSQTSSIIDMGVAFEIISKSGSHLSYNGTKLGNGKENAKKFLSEHQDISKEIEGKIHEAALQSIRPVEDTEPEVEDFDDAENFGDDD